MNGPVGAEEAGRLRRLGDPVLEQTARHVPRGGPLHALVERMRRVLSLHAGLGLAAPQIGEPSRVVLVMVDGLGAVVDPIIVDRSDAVGTDVEGCLSIPGLSVRVPRPRWVRVHGRTVDGEVVDRRLEGLAARVVCHEIDHLDGTLIVHRLPPSLQTQWRVRLRG